MTASRSVRYKLIADIGDFNAKLANASQSAKKFGNDLMAADKNGAAMRQGLSDLGGTAGKVGLLAAAGLGVAVMKAADFEQAMSNIQAATHETAGNMDILREAALKAGAETAFSATEAAAAIENLAKAGVSTADILGGGLDGALSLAAAGELEVAAAAEIAATALTQFNLAGEDVPHVADLLAAGAGKAQGEVSDLSSALNQSGLVAAQTGLSIEETVGTLSAFASAGLMGSDAGTSFKTMLQSLTPTGKKASEAMSDLGISAYDANGEFIGMAEFAGVLQNALKDMTVEQQNATMKTIFGSDAVRAASVLFSQGAEGIATWTNNVDDAGYAAETAAIKMDNLKGDWEGLTGALETALIGTGDGATGPLRELVQGLTAVTNAYNELPNGAKNATGAVLGIVAAAGLGVFAFSRVVTSIASTKVALTNLGVSADTARAKMSRIGRVAAMTGGVMSVGIAVGALADNLDRIDAGNLERSLDALGRGETTDTIKTVIDDLAYTTDKWNSIDLGEVVTVGGLFGDTTLDKKANNIKQLDEALAGLVETGEGAEAAELFAEIESQAKDAGVGADDVADSFEAYALAVRNAKGESDAAAGSATELGGAFGGVGDEAAGAEAEVQSLGDALDALLGVALDQDEATVAWKRSIQSLTSELKGGTDALNANTKKGQDNRDVIRSRVGDLQSMIAADEQAGVSVKVMERKMLQGAAAILESGVAAGISEDKMRQYLRQLGLTPKQIKTMIDAQTAQAQADLAAFNAAADAAARDRRMNILVTYSNLGNPGKAPKGTAPNQTYADGGYTGPGGKYEPAGIVHRGEVVLPQEVVQADWGFLRSRYGHLPGFADGGVVGRNRDPIARQFASGVASSGAGSLGSTSVSASLSLSDHDVSRIAEAVAAGSYEGAYDGVAQRDTERFNRERAGSRIGR